MDLNERAATWVKFDPVRGHITVNGNEGPALVTLVDTGQRLELWSHQAAYLSPDVARELGEALTSWASIRQGRAA